MQEQVDKYKQRNTNSKKLPGKKILEIKNTNTNNIIAEFVSRLDMTGKTLNLRT